MEQQPTMESVLNALRKLHEQTEKEASPPQSPPMTEHADRDQAAI
jgi:hypothetical protein